jgi:gas vesicle protein
MKAALDSMLGRRASMWIPITLFATGIVVGGMVALTLAPSSGKKLRRGIARFIWTELDAVETQASKIAGSVTGTVHDMLEGDHTKPRKRNGVKHA